EVGKNPLPGPLPEYQEREKSRCAHRFVSVIHKRVRSWNKTEQNETLGRFFVRKSGVARLVSHGDATPCNTMQHSAHFIVLKSGVARLARPSTSKPILFSAMSESYIQNLFAERIGGKSYGKSTEIYKFEKIKRAKRAALAANPGAELIDMGVGEPDEMAFPECVNALATAASRPDTRIYADNRDPLF